MDEFCEAFEAAIPGLIKQIMDKFSLYNVQQGFRSAWEEYEDVINPILIEFLDTRFGITEECTGNKSRKTIAVDNCYRKASSKSSYPDLKIIFKGKTYAIDIKSGESNKSPWYDIARLDTYIESHISKFSAEYHVVVKWSQEVVESQNNAPTPNRIYIDAVYIEPHYRTAGYKPASKGVLYRDYDGKIRPKGWGKFEEGSAYWNSKEDFLHALDASMRFRWAAFIVKWYTVMSEEERKRIKHYLNQIDKGEAVSLGDVPLNPGEVIDEETEQENKNPD